MLILQCSNIVKTYKNKSFRLNIKDINLAKGQVAALLGTNGSGKTTILKIILDLIFADAGLISIDGINNKDFKARENICYLPENYSVPMQYKAIEFLKLYGLLNRNDNAELIENINFLAEKFNATEYLNKKLSDLSKGMLQTIICIFVLLNKNKKLIILDEPFVGLDPIQKKCIIDYFKNLVRENGISILYSTHYLKDVEAFSDKVYLIKNGLIKDYQSKSDILQKFQSMDEYFFGNI